MLVTAVAVLTLPSCISLTRIHNEPKEPVAFASASAAQTFYEATYLPEGNEANSIELMTTLPLRIRGKDGPQLEFNKAVQAADTNGDRRISKLEAQRYAESKSELADPDKFATLSSFWHEWHLVN